MRDALSDLPSETVDVAELMTSELATNCVRHAETAFDLTVCRQGPVRIEVRDTGGGRPKVRHPKHWERTGRGLHIVQALADSWGVVPGPEGKTVWFTLPRAGSAADSTGAATPEREREDDASGRSDRGLSRMQPLWSGIWRGRPAGTDLPHRAGAGASARGA